MLTESAPRREETSPTGSAETTLRAIDVGTPVTCADGRDAGEVKLVFTDATTHRLTDFVVHAGTIVGRDRLVAANLVTKVGREGIVLSIDLARFNQLPEFRSDDDLAREIEQRIWDNDLLRRIDLPRLSFEVDQGIVTLKGPVAIDLHRTLAETIVEKIPGVRAVRNLLVADGDLEMAVAQALGDDPRTQRHIILVRAEHGIVYLAGDESADQANAAAFEVAASVPGVLEVRAETRRPEFVS